MSVAKISYLRSCFLTMILTLGYILISKSYHYFTQGEAISIVFFTFSACYILLVGLLVPIPLVVTLKNEQLKKPPIDLLQEPQGPSKLHIMAEEALSLNPVTKARAQKQELEATAQDTNSQNSITTAEDNSELAPQKQSTQLVTPNNPIPQEQIAETSPKTLTITLPPQPVNIIKKTTKEQITESNVVKEDTHTVKETTNTTNTEDTSPVTTPKNSDSLTTNNDNSNTEEIPKLNATSTTEDIITIYLGNLPYRLSNKGLRELFKPFGGTIHYASLSKDQVTHKLKGFGFVKISKVAGLDAIKNLNGQKIKGRNIVVKIANEKGVPPNEEDSNKEATSAQEDSATKIQ